MKPKRVLGIVAQLVLLALVVWAVWRRIAPALKGVSLGDFTRLRPAAGWLILATIGLTLLHLLQAFLWRRIVIDVGAPPPDARTTVRVYFMSGLARFIPGMVWQFPAFGVLGQQAGIPALASTAGGVIGNVAFLAVGIVFLAFTFPAAPRVAELLIGVLAAVAALAGVFLFTATAAGGRVRAWVLRHAPARLVPAVELAGRIRPSHALAWTLGYGASWVVLALSFTMFVEAFVPGSLAHARQLGGVMAASYILGYIVPLAPAGIGIREMTMAGFLAGLVPGPAAVLIPVAQRIWFFVAEFLALVSFPLFPRRAAAPRQRGDDERPDRTLMEVL